MSDPTLCDKALHLFFLSYGGSGMLQLMQTQKKLNEKIKLDKHFWLSLLTYYFPGEVEPDGENFQAYFKEVLFSKLTQQGVEIKRLVHILFDDNRFECDINRGITFQQRYTLSHGVKISSARTHLLALEKKQGVKGKKLAQLQALFLKKVLVDDTNRFFEIADLCDLYFQREQALNEINLELFRLAASKSYYQKLNNQVVKSVCAEHVLTRLTDQMIEMLHAVHPEVEALMIGYNDLTWLPENLPKLSMLKALDAPLNKFKSLPVRFERLTVLEWLNLSANRYSNFPIKLYGRLSLKKLSLGNLLEGNLLCEEGNVIPEISDRLTLTKNLQLLYVPGAGVKKISRRILHLLALKALYLQKNEAHAVPKSLRAAASQGRLSINFLDNPAHEVRCKGFDRQCPVLFKIVAVTLDVMLLSSLCLLFQNEQASLKTKVFLSAFMCFFHFVFHQLFGNNGEVPQRAVSENFGIFSRSTLGLCAIPSDRCSVLEC